MPLQARRADEAPGTDGHLPRPKDRRRTARRFALAVTIVCAVIMLYPVIASPITADDRYWYLWTAIGSDGSFVELFHWLWERIPSRVDDGRLNFITELERRLAGLTVIETAVATSTPIPVYQALLKLALFGAGILAILAFVRSLRWRTSDGSLVRVSRPSLLLIGVAGTLAVAVGAQAQNVDRNAWTAYPVSTYGAVIAIFGSIAFLLWLTRLVAERSRAMAVGATLILVVLGVTTNFRYGLVFPAVPIAAIALLIVPVTDRTHRTAGRRAKLVTGVAYLGSFIPVFLMGRLYLANVCANGDCYVGVQPELSTASVRTSAFNLLSAIPGMGGNELLSNFDRVGWADRYPVSPQWWSVLTGLIALATLTTLWWSTRQSQPTASDTSSTAISSTALRRTEAMCLIVGAGLAMLVALGTAAIMGLSSQSHELITQPGTPYRNTMVSWTGLAFCLVLLVVALTIISPRRKAYIAWSALALSIGLVATFTLPSNMMALRAHRVSHAVTDAFNREVVLGDATQSGNARRCALLSQIDGAASEFTGRLILRYSSTAFEQYHGQPFCSEAVQSNDG